MAYTVMGAGPAVLLLHGLGGTADFWQPVATDGKRRSITVRLQEQHQALQARRQRQQTAEFKRDYAKRAGVEGTISQSVRRCGIRRTRYTSLAKTRLQHLATASALNLLRLAEWLDETPRAKTRQSHFSRLMRQAA
ncbi:MAG TPA: transposase [Roseiflexaceae bacterium]|nr:transposase [Roseiflexaceae bacterium]